ncbi:MULTISPECIES: hypothetical protein [Acidobacteriaceae]|uniref:hypothetical protein n=1 Tax=Acidobacteriaceae TaxID=204434 RepID=UPI00131D144F|nr:MULTISPECIES: hypothetical protein [Acidobacteriaceae]MDW5264299.1 hypothetical protein [Edaphobacter sp.]
MPRTLAAIFFALVFLPSVTQAQQPDMPNMPGMGSKPMTMKKMGMMHQPTTLIEAELNHASSGTSAEPASTPTPMLMSHHGPWMLMLHGTAFISDTQQSGNRGADKLFSTNWLMPMAMRQLGPGQLTLRAMFSLEPATVSDRQYPELFQQGETAFGKPIIDGQHPHNFFMEVAALYDIPLGQQTLLSFYAAPIGDPAIGPTAYPHRLSASEDPLAALGHHQEDSTHIAYNVLTAGITWRGLRFEESGFHGGEPSEQRWGFQPSPNGHAIDSYSSRLTFSPTPNWSGQYSIAHIVSPEALYPNEDQQRQTASIMYNKPFGSTSHTGNWSNTLIWGRTRSLSDDSKENSYLVESLFQFRTRNYLWTRIENAGRSNELLISPGSQLPPNFEESPIGHVQAYTAGYDRDFHIAPHLLAAPGAQFTTYTAPEALVPTYGHHPFGVVAFVRFRLH